jgi:hypothetical protein
MNLISEPLKRRFAELHMQADTAIHRHTQLGMAEELQQLSRSVANTDSRDSYGQGGTIKDF